MHLKHVLPEEILLEIFSEIEHNELRKFLEISSEWRDLLIKNVKVMRKLPLILIKETWKEKLEFVTKYGKFVREIQFIDMQIDSFEDIAAILRLTPNVEKISLLRVKTPADNEDRENQVEISTADKTDEPFEKIKLRKLWKVTVEDEENVGSLNFVAINCDAKLTSLKCDLRCTDQQKVLIQIMSEVYLNSLEVSTNLDEIFSPTDEAIESIKCSMRRIIFNHVEVMKHNEQFIKFLKSQKKITEVGLIGGHMDFRYHQMMFTTFPFARKIYLNVDALATSDCLTKIKKVPANKNIESLTISGLNLHINIFDAVLKLAPKLHQLHVHNLTRFYSEQIKKLPLTHLKVDRVKRCCLKPECLSQVTKVEIIDVVPAVKEIYERNLQTFCDINRLGADKNKDITDAL